VRGDASGFPTVMFRAVCRVPCVLDRGVVVKKWPFAAMVLVLVRSLARTHCFGETRLYLE